MDLELAGLLRKVNLLENTEQRLLGFFMVQCAPLLKKETFSNCFLMGYEECMKVIHLFQGTEICCALWKPEGKGKCILFLYRKEKLKDWITKKCIREFLVNCGYPVKTQKHGNIVGNERQCKDGDTELTSILFELSHRMKKYMEKEAGFPHELGIFLGYPLGDVQAFINHHGKNYRYLGYYKVYGNVEAAKQLFAKYDICKKETILEYLQGKSISQICQ